jgi:hypothetical protein
LLPVLDDVGILYVELLEQLFEIKTIAERIAATNNILLLEKTGFFINLIYLYLD